VHHYLVYRDTISGFTPNPDAPLAASYATAYVDLEVEDGIVHYYRVSAVDSSDNEGEYSDEAEASVPDQTAPSQVADLRAAASDTDVVLTWMPASDNVGVHHYLVYRDTTSGFVPNPDVSFAPSYDTVYVDSQVEHMTSYYYRVSAVDSSGNRGEYSDEIEAAVPGACGDCNFDERISIADANYIVNHIYRGGSAPLGSGDVNSDGRTTVADANYIVSYIYRDGPAPCESPRAGRPLGVRAGRTD
jgi:hypothetical protein